jgi:hypothetical protein
VGFTPGPPPRGSPWAIPARLSSTSLQQTPGEKLGRAYRQNPTPPIDSHRVDTALDHLSAAPGLQLAGVLSGLLPHPVKQVVDKGSSGGSCWGTSVEACSGTAECRWCHR